MPWVDLSDNNPGRLDMAIRIAIHQCWDALPVGKQTLEYVERLVRSRVDRAFRDMQEDAEVFGEGLAEGAGSKDEVAVNL